MFSDGVWDLIIVVVTVGSLFGLFFLTRALAQRPQSHGSSGDGEVSGDVPPRTMGHVWDRDLVELNNPLPRWWVNLFYITLVFVLVYLIKRGLEIDRDLARDARASELKLKAVVRRLQGRFDVVLTGDLSGLEFSSAADAVTLHFRHRTRAERDLQIPLEAMAPGRYGGNVS